MQENITKLASFAVIDAASRLAAALLPTTTPRGLQDLPTTAQTPSSGTAHRQTLSSTRPIHHGRTMPIDCQIVITGLPPSGSIEAKAIISALCPAGSPQPVAFVDRNIPVINNVIILHFSSVSEQKAALLAMHANTTTLQALAISTRNIRGGQSRQQRQHTISSREVIATASHHIVTTEVQHSLHTLLDKHQAAAIAHGAATEQGLAAAAEAVHDVKAAITEVLSMKPEGTLAAGGQQRDEKAQDSPSRRSDTPRLLPEPPAQLTEHPGLPQMAAIEPATTVTTFQRRIQEVPSAPATETLHPLSTYGDLLDRRSAQDETSELPTSVTYGQLLQRRLAGEDLKPSLQHATPLQVQQQANQFKSTPPAAHHVDTPSVQRASKHSSVNAHQPDSGKPPATLTVVLSPDKEPNGTQAQRDKASGPAQPRGLSGNITISRKSTEDGRIIIETVPARVTQRTTGSVPAATPMPTPAGDIKRTAAPRPAPITYVSDVDRQLASILTHGVLKRTPKHVRFEDTATDHLDVTSASPQRSTAPAHADHAPAGHDLPNSAAAALTTAAAQSDQANTAPSTPQEAALGSTSEPLVPLQTQRYLAVEQPQATTRESPPHTPVLLPSGPQPRSDASEAESFHDVNASVSSQHGMIVHLIRNNCRHWSTPEAPQHPAQPCWASTFNFISTLTGIPTLPIDKYQQLVATANAEDAPTPSRVGSPSQREASMTDTTMQAASTKLQLQRLIGTMIARTPVQGSTTTTLHGAEITHAMTAITLVVYKRLGQHVPLDLVQAVVTASEDSQRILLKLAHAQQATAIDTGPSTPRVRPQDPDSTSPTCQTPYQDANLVDRLGATTVSVMRLPGSGLNKLPRGAPRRLQHAPHPSPASANDSGWTPAQAARVIMKTYTENARAGGPLLTTVTGAGAHVMCSMCGLIGSGAWFNQHKQEAAVVRPLMCDSETNQPICVWNRGTMPTELMDALCITLNGRRYSTHEAWITLAVDTLTEAKRNGSPSNAVLVCPRHTHHHEPTLQLWCPTIHSSWLQHSLSDAAHCNGCGETFHKQFMLQHAASTALASLAYLTTPCASMQNRSSCMPASTPKDRNVTIAAYEAGYAKRRHIADSLRNMLHILVTGEPHTWDSPGFEAGAMTHKLTKLAAAAVVRTDAAMRGHGLTTEATVPLDKLAIWTQQALVDVIPAEITAQMQAVMADLWTGLAVHDLDKSKGTHLLTVCAACHHVEIVTGGSCNHCARRRRPEHWSVPNAHGCFTSCKHVSVTANSPDETARLAGAAAWALAGGLQTTPMRFSTPSQPGPPSPTLFITTAPSCTVPLEEQALVDDSVQQWEDGAHASDSNGGARVIAPVLTIHQLKAGVMCSGCGVILVNQQHLEYHITEAQVAMHTVRPLNYGIHCSDAKMIAMNATIVHAIAQRYGADNNSDLLPVRAAHFPINNLECLGANPAEGTAMPQLIASTDLPVRFVWDHLLFYYRTGSHTLLQAIHEHSSIKAMQRAVTATQLIWLARWHGKVSSASAMPSAEMWWRATASTTQLRTAATPDAATLAQSAAHFSVRTSKPDGPDASQSNMQHTDSRLAGSTSAGAKPGQAPQESALAMLAHIQEKQTVPEDPVTHMTAHSTSRQRRPSDLPITTASGHCTGCGTVYIDSAVQLKHRRQSKPGSCCADSTFAQPVLMTAKSRELATSGDWSQAKAAAREAYLTSKQQTALVSQKLGADLEAAMHAEEAPSRPQERPTAESQAETLTSTAFQDTLVAHDKAEPSAITTQMHERSQPPILGATALNTAEPTRMATEAQGHAECRAAATTHDEPAAPAIETTSESSSGAAQQPLISNAVAIDTLSSQRRRQHATADKPVINALKAPKSRLKREMPTTLPSSPFTQAAHHYWQKKLRALELAHSAVAARTKAHVGGVFNMRTACQADCGTILSSIKSRVSHHKACTECSRTQKQVYYSLPMSGVDQLQLAHNADAHVWNIVRRVMWAEHVTQTAEHKRSRIMTDTQLEACTSSESSITSHSVVLPAEASSLRTPVPEGDGISSHSDE